MELLTALALQLMIATAVICGVLLGRTPQLAGTPLGALYRLTAGAIACLRPRQRSRFLPSLYLLLLAILFGLFRSHVSRTGATRTREAEILDANELLCCRCTCLT